MYLSGRKCSQSVPLVNQRRIVSAQNSCFNFKTISVTDFNTPGITNFCFSWPKQFQYQILKVLVNSPCQVTPYGAGMNPTRFHFWNFVAICLLVLLFFDRGAIKCAEKIFHQWRSSGKHRLSNMSVSNFVAFALGGRSLFTVSEKDYETLFERQEVYRTATFGSVQYSKKH